jgi:hypothetical protein
LRKIESFLKKAKPYFLADGQYIRWSFEEYNGKFIYGVNIEKDFGEFVRYRGFDVYSFIPNPEKIGSAPPGMIYYDGLKSISVFNRFDINKDFGILKRDLHWPKSFAMIDDPH